MSSRLLPTAIWLLHAVFAAATTFKVRQSGSSFAALDVEIGPGESIRAEPGCIVTMAGSLRLSAKVSGLGRMFAGESMLHTELNSVRDGAGAAMLCPAEIGDIECMVSREWFSYTQ